FRTDQSSGSRTCCYWPRYQLTYGCRPSSAATRLAVRPSRTHFASRLDSRVVLMRYVLAILILTCAGCRPSVDDLLAEAERAEKEMLARAEAEHTLESFDGALYGKDLGEWGGEVGFREPD